MSRKGKKGSSAEPQQAEAQVQAAQAQLIESLREQVAAAQESARQAETKLGELQEYLPFELLRKIPSGSL